MRAFTVNKRFDFFDIARGITILLVVYGHICRNEVISTVLSAFRMPAFFFFSGIFFNPYKYNTLRLFVNRRLKSLIFPYFSFGILSYLYWVLIENNISHNVDIMPLKGLLYGTDNGCMYSNVALWFLPALFISHVINYIIHKYAQSSLHYYIYLFVFFVIAIAIDYFDIYRMPFSLNSSFMAVFFVGLGYKLKTEVKVINSYRKRTSLTLLPIFMMVLLPVVLMNGETSMDYTIYKNPLLFVLSAGFGILTLLFISQLIRKSVMFSFLGKNSLIILGLHFPILRGVIQLYGSIFSFGEMEVRYSNIHSTICTIVTILIIIPFIFLFNQKLYMIIGREKSKIDVLPIFEPMYNKSLAYWGFKRRGRHNTMTETATHRHKHDVEHIKNIG